MRIDPYSIHSPTGILQTQQPLDYESHRSHNLTIRAVDPVSGSFSDALVIVTLRDVNDNSPQFSQSHYRASVSEVAPPGTLVMKVRIYKLLSYLVRRGLLVVLFYIAIEIIT